jgi:hypothetical protein
MSSAAESVLTWVPVFLSALVLLSFLTRRTIRLPRDFFVVTLYVQSFVYLQLAPALYLQSDTPVGPIEPPDGELRAMYHWMQLACVILFQWPLLAVYGRSTSARRRQSLPLSGGSTRPARVVLFSLATTGFGVAYLYQAVSSGLLLLPRDNASLPAFFAGLPFYEFALNRLYTYSGLFLSGVLLAIALRREHSFLPRFVAAGAFLTCFSVWSVQALLNARSQAVIGMLLIIGVWFAEIHRRSLLTRGNALRIRVAMVAAAMSVVYVGVVAHNIRYGFVAEGGFVARMLSPVPAYSAFSGAEDPWGQPPWRLNGVDLMARITPAALSDGYASGEAWKYTAYALLGQFISRSAVEEFKLNRLVDPKIYLLRRYTSFDPLDWPVSILTDGYGNFGPVGLVMVALVLGLVYGLGSLAMTEGASGVSAAVGIFVISQSLLFDQLFGNWLFGLPRAIPALALVLLIRPLDNYLAPALARRSDSGPLARLGQHG